VNKPTVNKTWVLFKSMAGFLASRLGDMEDDVSAIFDQRAIQTIGNTVDALWGQLQDLSNYQAMADYLGRDHSSTQSGQLNGDEDNEMQEGADSAELESCYQLTGMEETVLVYVFVICLTKLAGEKKKVRVIVDDSEDTNCRFILTRINLMKLGTRSLNILFKRCPSFSANMVVISIA
jgi:hypothetical protein